MLDAGYMPADVRTIVTAGKLIIEALSVRIFQEITLICGLVKPIPE